MGDLRKSVAWRCSFGRCFTRGFGYADKSRNWFFRLTWSVSRRHFYVITVYCSLAGIANEAVIISGLFRVSTDNRRHCDADCRVWLKQPMCDCRPWTNVDILFRVRLPAKNYATLINPWTVLTRTRRRARLYYTVSYYATALQSERKRVSLNLIFVCHTGSLRS